MRNRRRAVLIALAVVVGRSACGPRHDRARGAPAAYDPDDAYPGIERRSLYLPMRDGVRVAVDVYLPEGLAAGTRVPALLHQTRYWRSFRYRAPLDRFFDGLEPRGRHAEVQRRAIRRGYAWVDVDTRGSGASFGLRPWDSSPQELRDGAEIVDWIVRQPWSDGKVGALGVSYSGSTAEFLLANLHPAVRAVAAVSCIFDQYTDILAPGGVPHVGWLDAWGAATRALDRNELPAGAFARWLIPGVRPVDADPDGALLAAAVAEHAGNYDFSALRYTFRDDNPLPPVDPKDAARAGALDRATALLAERFGPDFMAMGIDLVSPHAYRDALRAAGVPVYAAAGWFDLTYANAAVKRFLTIANSGSRLLIGPWDHTLHNVSPYDARGETGFDAAGEFLKFFDYHLKGIDTGIAREAPVHYFTMGEERWKAADAWPPPSAARSYYLAADGALATEAPLVANASDAYTVDFAAATGHQSRWDTGLAVPLTDPYPDRAERDRRLLTYTTAPLGADTEVTGHPVVRLYVRSTARDGAFIAYLEDVAPDGAVHYVSEGMLRALHRETDDEPSPTWSPIPHRGFRRADAREMVPGETAELVFDLQPISYRFPRGHAIRLALAGADADHFARIPESGPAPTVHYLRERAHASRIELPVVAARAESP